jgi:hypothetical protein
MQLNNFQSVMQVISGLEAASVGRLKKSWQCVDQKTLEVWSDIKRSVSFEKNYKVYRSILSTIQEPCVPFLGLVLSDLTFLDQGNQTFITDQGIQLINLQKMRLISSAIENVQMFQANRYYNIHKKYNIASALSQVSEVYTEKEAFEKSLALEPRDQKLCKLSVFSFSSNHV